jgi:hypothetical protein
MNYVKPQLLTDTFYLAKRGGKKKGQKTTPKPNNTKKSAPPETPASKRVPLTPEAKKESGKPSGRNGTARPRPSGSVEAAAIPPWKARRGARAVPKNTGHHAGSTTKEDAPQQAAGTGFHQERYPATRQTSQRTRAGTVQRKEQLRKPERVRAPPAAISGAPGGP